MLRGNGTKRTHVCTRTRVLAQHSSFDQSMPISATVYVSSTVSLDNEDAILGTPAIMRGQARQTVRKSEARHIAVVAIQPPNRRDLQLCNHVYPID